MAREIPVGDAPGWAEALEAWDRRRDADEAARALRGFEALADLEPESPHAFAWLGRARWFAGTYAPTDREKQRHLDRGFEAASRGVKIDAGHLPARFWTAVCLERVHHLKPLVKNFPPYRLRGYNP